MILAHHPSELEPAVRTIAIGTFDGVHRGHRAVIEAAVAGERRSTVVTFDPHPRKVLGYDVELLSSVQRRLDLIRKVGPDETLVVEFTLELSQLSPNEFVNEVIRPLGVEAIIVGANFRFGHARQGDVDLLQSLGFDVQPVPLVGGVSSTQARALIHGGDVAQTAKLLGRPFELEGVVVAGDRRGGTLGFPTANLAVAADSIVPAYGIYAGSTLGHRAAMSIGINPHYGGTERRIEVHLLDFNADLYGEHLVVEVWSRLRGELAFESETALVTQIEQDVADARSASRPAAARPQ